LTIGLNEDVTEKMVTEAWRDLLDNGCKLQTETGQSLRVIYPGKSSDIPGSDFQDAVIAVNRQTFRGNIELHVKSSDWHKHGHDRNPAYNGVVLHVAWQQDCDSDIKLQNGAVIPAVILERYLENNMGTFMSGKVICSGVAGYSPDKLLEIVDQAGGARFYEKAARFQNQLKFQDAGQCLYSGIMTALGYARNKEAFQQLAERVPLNILESLVQENNEDERSLVWLLGTAGLLPSQRPEIEYSPSEDYAYVHKLEKAWETFQQIDVMDFSNWQSFRVRPSNSPLRRITGMCHLLQLYQEQGLLRGLVELVRDCPTEKMNQYLEAGLVAADKGYWASRFDFGKGYPGLSKWLIGQSRAADMVINVLLPFIYARGEDNHQQELSDKAFTIFCSYPSLETNTIERHMSAQFGLKNIQVNSAQRQQGLLHLYKKWCTQGRCKECAIVSRG
jgi:hypothetical protein